MTTARSPFAISASARFRCWTTTRHEHQHDTKMVFDNETVHQSETRSAIGRSVTVKSYISGGLETTWRAACLVLVPHHNSDYRHHERKHYDRPCWMAMGVVTNLRKRWLDWPPKRGHSRPTERNPSSAVLPPFFCSPWRRRRINSRLYCTTPTHVIRDQSSHNTSHPHLAWR